MHDVGPRGPKFVEFFSPVLEAIRQLGGSGRPSEVRDLIAQREDVPEARLEELLASGTSRFDNQVAWARFYLVRAGLIASSRRGVWSLTERGAALAPLSHENALVLFKRGPFTVPGDYRDARGPGYGRSRRR